jgi:hypothetical protein
MTLLEYQMQLTDILVSISNLLQLQKALQAKQTNGRLSEDDQAELDSIQQQLAALNEAKDALKTTIAVLSSTAVESKNFSSVDDLWVFNLTGIDRKAARPWTNMIVESTVVPTAACKEMLLEHIRCMHVRTEVSRRAWMNLILVNVLAPFLKWT